MTHDALPADTGLLKALTDALFSEKDIAVAYETASRKGLQYHRAHTREFNYRTKAG